MNTKIKALLAFGTIFILGFGSGYLFKDLVPESNNDVTAERFESGQRGPDRPDDFNGPDMNRIEDRIATMLDLSEDQRESFFNRMGEYRVNIMSGIVDIRNQETEMLRERYNTFRSDISTILNDDQLLRLDSHFHPDSVDFGKMRGGRR